MTRESTLSRSQPRHLPHSRTFPEVCDDLRRKVVTFLEEQTDDELLQNVQNRIRVSMGVIEEALKRYGPEQLSLSYNGGKDCLVLLVLILACLPAWASSSTSSDSNAVVSSNSTSNSKITNVTRSSISSSKPPSSVFRPFPQSFQAVYVVSTRPFPEVETFVAASATHYHLDLARYALPMRLALEAYLGEKTAVKAIFVGTRRTDPHGKFLTHFDPTDNDWPRLMRVHPVIEWHYVEIWAFIRHLGIPFCSLYNQGFTSLGGMTDTHPNPALALDAKAMKFRPAYELVDDNEERLGRYR